MDHLFATKLWNPSELSPFFIVFSIVLSSILIGLFPYFLRRYTLRMNELRFREQIGNLELEREDSNILWDLVHRYTLNEPVQILHSLPLFDELAQKEMVRVLSHPSSSRAKMQYIDHLYGLRQKMYFEGFQ